MDSYDLVGITFDTDLARQYAVPGQHISESGNFGGVTLILIIQHESIRRGWIRDFLIVTSVTECFFGTLLF